jgi:hypothetical protein
MLQANLGPSFAQCTPFMATRQGATTSKTKNHKNIKSNVKINILDETYALHDESISWINGQL